MPSFRTLVPWLFLPMVACGDNPTETLQLSESDIGNVADFIVAGQPSLPSGAANSVAPLVAGGPANVVSQVNNTLPCPAGGTTVVTGTIDRVPNQETRRTSVTWTTSAVHDDCAFQTAQRSWTFTSGTVNISGTALFAFPSQPGGAPTMLEMSMTRNGSITIAVGERSLTCSVSLATVYTATSDSFSTTGKVCERDVNISGRPRGGLGG